MQTLFCVRTLGVADAEQALELYSELTYGPACRDPSAFLAVLAHPGTRIFGADSAGLILGMVTLHILPNVTWDARPYALIENVVTRADRRGKGIGRKVMQTAIDAAWASDAYKIMLMTGQRRGAAGFYEALGFSSEDKQAMVMRSA